MANLGKQDTRATLRGMKVGHVLLAPRGTNKQERQLLDLVREVEDHGRRAFNVEYAQRGTCMRVWRHR